LADPVLSAALSGKRAILLSWTYGANADFQVFWKSSSPPGQEYVLLATTNAFSYTTADLDPSKTYFFYVRVNVGATYYYSNVVELFVSCGKGVILSSTPPVQPPAQVLEGHFYACVFGGDIYKMSGSIGSLVPLGQTARGWYGISVAPNGDVYASVNGGGIYKSIGGTGTFIKFSTGSDVNSTTQMNCGQDGSVWYITYNGAGMFKSPTGNPGTFSYYGLNGKYDWGLCIAPNGDVYGTEYGPGGSAGNIWKQTSGVGSFVGVGPQPTRWYGMCAARNGDIYACTAGAGQPALAGIWKQTAGAGAFVQILAQAGNWIGMAAAPNGDIYACISGGDIYKKNSGSSIFVALGVTSRLWYDIAVGPNTSGITGG
jgi:hypothetical protein